jgi:hypothetical protein
MRRGLPGIHDQQAIDQGVNREQLADQDVNDL